MNAMSQTRFLTVNDLFNLFPNLCLVFPSRLVVTHLGISTRVEALVAGSALAWPYPRDSGCSVTSVQKQTWQSSRSSAVLHLTLGSVC